MARSAFARFVCRPPSADESDRDLLARFTSDRDHAAFESLVRRHARSVLAACRQVLSDPADVDDAFQATFLVLLRRADSVRWQESLGGWLYAVAHRVAVHARSAARRRKDREARHVRPSTPGPDLSWQEACAVLHEELDRLPDRYRLPLLLCYLDGLSRDEAARRLGWSVGAVKGRLERGRQRLAERLARRGVTPAAGLLSAVAGGSAATGGPSPELVAAALRAAAGHAPPAVRALAHGASRMSLLGYKPVVALTAALAAVVAVGVGFDQPRTNAQDKPAGGGKMPAKADKPAEKPKAEPIPVVGRVLDPDGKPAAGVKLYAPKVTVPDPETENDITAEPLGSTDADGTFAVTVPPTVGLRNYLVAHAPGFGVDWLEVGTKENPKPTGEQTLRLVKDVPITGRVVSTEGKPVPGVTVSVHSIYVPADDKLDAYLKGWLENLRDNLGTPRKRLYLPLDRIAGAATTDADGRFTVRGAGTERIVHLLIHGSGVARSVPYVITRPGFDPKPYNDELLKKDHDSLRVLNRFLGLYGPDLTFVAEPGKTIEGTVTDAATGKPVPGCRVGAMTGFGDGVMAETGPDGAYRLTGIPKNPRGYSPSISPPKGTAYLSAHARAADTGGFAPVRADVKLVKGVVVTGRVVDKATGKGVSAGIRLAPLPDNKYYGKPGYDGYNSDRTTSGTAEDGRFRVVTIPGAALVMAQAHGGQTFAGQYLNPYRRATPDPAHKDLFRPEGDRDSWIVTTAGNSIEFLSSEHAVKVVDVKPDGETTVELVVDRGTTGKLEVRDADGKPLAGAWVAGLTDAWPITFKLPEATATVYALNPEKPRTMYLYHPGTKLGGSVTIRGDEKEPVVAKLAPVGTVTGRFLDPDGGPLVGAEVTVNPNMSSVGSELYRFANPTGKPPVTDKDGRFTLPGVVPGLSFYLQIRKGDGYYAGKPKIGLLTVEPGQTKDIGERQLERLR